MPRPADDEVLEQILEPEARAHAFEQACEFARQRGGLGLGISVVCPKCGGNVHLMDGAPCPACGCAIDVPPAGDIDALRRMAEEPERQQHYGESRKGRDNVPAIRVLHVPQPKR